MKQMYYAVHIHKYGDSVYHFETERDPYNDQFEQDLIKAFDIDYDPDKEEELNIIPVNDIKTII